MFNLTVQYLEKYRRTVQQLTYRDCQRMLRQAELLGEEVGDGRAEGQQLEMDFQYRPEG